MVVYFATFIIIIVVRLFVKNNKVYCGIATTILFAVLALRDINIGVDLPYYQRGYEYIRTLSLFNVISKLRIIQTARLDYMLNFESGYVVLNWIVSRLGISFHGFLMACALINVYSFGKFIYKYSYRKMLGFVILMGINVYEYFFGIIRQSLALSVAIWSIAYLVENKNLKSYLLLFCAFMLHRAAIVLLPLVFVHNIRITRKKFRIILLLEVFFWLVSKPFFRLVIARALAFIGKGRDAYVSISPEYNNLILVSILILLIIYFFIDFQVFDDEMLNLSCWCVFGMFGILILGVLNASFARSSEFYSAFLIVLLPGLIATYNNRNTRFVTSMVLCLAMFVMFSIGIYGNTYSVYSFI